MWEDTKTGQWTKRLTRPTGRVTLGITKMAGGLKYEWSVWAYDHTDRSIFHDRGMTKSFERAEMMIDKSLRRAKIEAK